MKISKCRVCSNNLIKSVGSLGNQYYTGIFPCKKNFEIPKGDLSLVLCSKCKLLQLNQSFDINLMYGSNYGYMSSLNLHMIRHLNFKANKLRKIIDIKRGDIIVDVGSNDGTYLKNFNSSYILIGIDPTIKKLKKYYRKDIITYPNFFSKELISEKFKNKKAKIITTISMFYDLHDPIKFAQDIYEVLHDEGIWHLEQSYMPSMIKNISYDTICHEHIEYYSLFSIKYIFDHVGFKIIDLEFNDINGGSFAITLAKKKSTFKEITKTVDWLLKKEDIFNYNSAKTHVDFFTKVKNHKFLLKKLLLNIKSERKKIYGYGASTKGNVILQYCGIDSDILDCIVDANIDKHNKYTPGTKIKIIHESHSKIERPDFMLVLPWHFKNFIIKKEEKFIMNGGKFIFPLPDIEII